MDTALENALTRRADLVKEIEKIDKFIAAYREFAGDDAQLPDLSAVPITTRLRAFGPRPGSESTVKAAPRPQNPPLEVLVPAAIEIMRAKGRPMSRRELHDALTERDLEVKGADPRKTLGAILWRAREYIDSLEGRGYWPKGDPVPPVSLEEPHAKLLAERKARRAKGIPKRT